MLTAGASIVLFVAAVLAYRFSQRSIAEVHGSLDGIDPGGAPGRAAATAIGAVTGMVGSAGWVAGSLSRTARGDSRLLSRKPKEEGPAWAAFVRDARKSLGHSRRFGAGDQRNWIYGLIAFGALLRVLQMGAPISHDEAFTYTSFASRPFSTILSDYSSPNNHMLHTLLVKVSTGIFGAGIWQLRLPALLAGIAVLPLFYLFARAMFNRYIALIGLALLAGSGGLIEYSALGRGYSLGWVFFLCALLAGRHFAKTNNTFSAVTVGVSCALGMWTVPTSMYWAATVFVWLMLYLGGKYSSSLQQRIAKLLLSVAVFLVLTLLFYSPVLIVHGLPYLMSHPELGETSWDKFVARHQDNSFDLWIYIVDTSRAWIAFAGYAGIMYAAYITSKFRKLFAAMLIACVPLVLVQMNVPPPSAWNWMVIIFHLSSAIALFYLLKFIQDKFAPAFNKRFRTHATAVVLALGTGALSTYLLPRTVGLPRFPEAAVAAEELSGLLQPGDLVLTEHPWEAVAEFEALAHGIQRAHFHLPGHPVPGPGTRIYVLVSPASGQTTGSVLEYHSLAPGNFSPPVKLKDWTRLEIHAAVAR